MNHLEVEELKKQVRLKHAWDFVFALGDTIKEKMNSLLEIIQCCCVRQKGKNTRAMVFARKELAGCLSVSIDLNKEVWEPVYKEEEDMFYIGKYVRDCGGNGYESGFDLYEDNKLESEILVVCGDEVKLIDIYNYVF